VCVQASPGRRDLVLVSLSAGAPRTVTTLVSEPETQFNAPRWSPDGLTIAVERHTPGHQSAIVLVDVATRAARTVAADPKARFVSPAWRPDGRAVVAAADLDEGPFELYEIAVDQTIQSGVNPHEQPVLRRLTRTNGGAAWPDVSPDGKTIVFVGYTADGFDLFTVPYPANSPEPAAVALSGTSEPETVLREKPSLSSAVRRYNPLATLKPVAWLPVIEGDSDQLRVGFSTGGADVLAYHPYSVSATWLASHRTDVSPPRRAEPDWQFAYQYARWRPTWWFSASTQTSFLSGPPDERGVPTAATLRERQIESGVFFPVRHVRVSQAALFSVVAGLNDYQFPDVFVSTRRAAWRAGWVLDSTQTYGYSISPEQGASIGITAELARRGLGSSADANTVTADARLYIPAFAPHHVLAIRLAGAVSTGDELVRRTFLLGGDQPNLSTLDFGRSAISLLRGFGADTFAGNHVALLNADYRWPIARPQRGHGTWPIFLHTVHAAVFADIGHAWTETFDVRDLKTSAGGELSLDVVAGYFAPFTATLGAAWGRDGSHTVRDRGSVYVRIGRAF
jgi:WD40-like Beta Propeller Repeat